MNELAQFVRDNNAILTVALAAAISVLVKFIDHKVENLKPATIASIVGILGLAGSAADWYLSQSSQNPTILGQYTVTVTGVVFFVYNYIVKKVYLSLIESKASKDAAAALGEAEPAVDLPAAAPAPKSAVEVPLQAQF